MKSKICKIFGLKKILPTKILQRTTLLSWLLIIITVLCFALVTIPQNQKLILDRMELEAADFAASIIYSNSSSIIAEEYQHVVEYCMNMIKSSRSLEYIVIAKKNDKALVFTRSGWLIDNSDSLWSPETITNAKIEYSNLINENAFHSTNKYFNSTIHWGWIHVGLSLKGYREATNNMLNYTLILLAVFVIIGFVASLFFAKTISNPITELSSITKIIADGNLQARVNINTGDEIEVLAKSFNAMTDTLRNTQIELEDRVNSRTLKLSEANETLKEEIIERRKVENSLHKYAMRLESLQRIYRGIISAQSNSSIIRDTLKNLHQVAPIHYANITIYSEGQANLATYSIFNLDGMVEVMGEIPSESLISSMNEFKNKNYFIIHDLSKISTKSPKEETICYTHGIKTYLCVALKYQNEILGELNIGNKDPNSISENVIEDVREITNQLAVAIAQTKLNEQIASHSKNIENSLAEKIVLLKEVHHRVKNNLQIISSLLFLQSKRVNDIHTLDVLRETEYRVKSMALVHEKLYRSDNLSKIDLKDYIKSLTNVLVTSFKQRSKVITSNYDLVEVFLPINISIPIGLILNEVLTNALKHAFNDRPEGNIDIKLNQSEDLRLRLEIKDNGKGLPDDFDIQQSQSLGFKLINSLIEQINGKFSFYNDGGAVFIFDFPYNNVG